MILGTLLLALAARIPTSLLPESDVAPPQHAIIRGAFDLDAEPLGNAFLIVSTQPQIWSSIRYAMLVDADGAPLLPESIQLPNGAIGYGGVASNGRTALIVNGTKGATSGVLIDRDGTARAIAIHAPTRPQVTSHDVFGIRDVAWDGTQFIVISTNETLTPNQITSQPIATRVSESGEILENDIPIGVGAFRVAARNGVTVFASTTSIQPMNGAVTQLAAGSDTIAAIAAGSDGFLVVTSEGRAQHLDAAGNVDRPSFTLPRSGAIASVAWDGTSWLVTNGAGAVLRVTSSGALLETIVAAPATVVASNESTSIVASGSDGVKAARLGDGDTHDANVGRVQRENPVLVPNGIVYSDPSGIWLNTLGGASPQRVVEGALNFRGAASSDAGTIVVWDDATGLYAQILGRERVLISSDPNRFNRPLVSVAATPTQFAIAYVESGVLRVARVNIGGAQQLEIAFAPGNTDLALAACGETLLVAWVNGYADALHGAIVGVTGPFDIAEAQLSPDRISLASDGEQFLATWISAVTTNNAWVGARLVTRQGTIAGNPSKYIYSLGGPRKSNLRALWSGTNYLVLWKEESELTAVRIARDGELLDYPPQRIGTIPSPFDAMLTGPETLVIAYTRTMTLPAPTVTDLVFRYAVVPRIRITR